MPSDFPKYRHGFRNLIAWKEAHAFTLRMYDVVKKLPPSEKFGMIDQLIRASSSIGSNIAEGAGRRTVKDQNQFYYIAKSSLSEVDNFLELAHDLSYIDDATYNELLNHLNRIAFLLMRLIKSQRNKPSKPSLHSDLP